MKKQKKEQQPYTPPIREPQQAQPAPAQPKLPFDVWWILYSSQRKLSPDLKEPMRKHFQARGFWASQDWEAGVKDFGF